MSDWHKNGLDRLWNEFLDELDRSNDFDKELRVYLESIKCVSEISTTEIDNEKYRDEINIKIKSIVNFIDKYKGEYFEISKIEGFKANDNDLISGRDYYYYIADQQVKASIYYVRYLNFLNRSQLNQIRLNELWLNICTYKNEISLGTLDENIPIDVQIVRDECKKVIDIINEKCGPEQNYEEIKQKCIQYLDEIELSESIEYKKYIMFNNMMREIHFFGAAYQYLWHWKKERKTLYRCGILEDDHTEQAAKTKERYVKNMFTDCINHMNSPSRIRHSYSENLLLDIYKYLVLPKQKSESASDVTIFSQEGISISSLVIKNTNTVVFNIIKDADINCIFVKDKAKAFHEFIVGENLNDYDLPYTVEMYPQTLFGEKNEKGTTKGMRDKFLPMYFNSWGISCSLSKTKIADDKEVITYGKCYSKKILIDNENTLDKYENYSSGTLFTMTLTKEDIIYLLLKINKVKKKQIEDIVDSILCKMSWEKVEGNFNEVYVNNEQNNFCKYKYGVKSGDTKFDFLVITRSNQFSNDYINDKNERLTIDAAKQKYKSKIKRIMKSYLTTRYQGICPEDGKNLKCDFILSTINQESSYCFDWVKKYTEYMADKEDDEITLLKSIIFKE